ncbi:uncharacterized protein LOC130263223, partial [Oenanthe melanoleuca]|uniref:uncharacterized protein LOC130263223 n=1 Tax=Oenanthe melanoleuca TaxID=2939378 RepID=UPI0024C10FE2
MPCPRPAVPSPVVALAGCCPLSPAGATQLLVQPPWTPAVLWDRVTLTCQGSGTAGDTLWYKNLQRWWPEGRDNFTVAESGTYWCYRPGTGISPTVRVSDDSLVLQVPARALLEGDTVTLRCRGRRDLPLNSVTFYRDGKKLATLHNVTELSLSHLELHSGRYRCSVWVGTSLQLRSAPVPVTVQELFTVPLLEGPPELPEGSPLNLSCLSTPSPLRPPAPLLYRFYRDGQSVGGPQGSPQLLVPAVGVSHSGNYSCEVRSEGGTVRKSSARLGVTVRTLSVSPQCPWPLDPPGAQWLRGSLCPCCSWSCSLWPCTGGSTRVPGSARKGPPPCRTLRPPTWSCGGRVGSPGNPVTSMTTCSQSCDTRGRGSPQSGGARAPGRQKAPGQDPREEGAVLDPHMGTERAGPQTVFLAGATQLLVQPPWTPAVLWDRVTLTCRGSGTAGDTLWYKNLQRWWPEGRDNFTVAESGTYWCYRPGAARALLEGDTVTLRCRGRRDLPLNSVTFYRDGKKLATLHNVTELSLSHLELHSGRYRCSVWVGTSLQLRSAAVPVTVQELFTVPLLEGPPELPEGSPLNLSCLSTPSPLRPPAPLLYRFYRDGQSVGGPQGSPQLLVPAVGVSHSGNYSCEVRSEGGTVRKSSARLGVTVRMPVAAGHPWSSGGVTR